MFDIRRLRRLWSCFNLIGLLVFIFILQSLPGLTAEGLSSDEIRNSEENTDFSQQQQQQQQQQTDLGESRNIPTESETNRRLLRLQQFNNDKPNTKYFSDDETVALGTMKNSDSGVEVVQDEGDDDGFDFEDSVGGQKNKKVPVSNSRRSSRDDDDDSNILYGYDREQQQSPPQDSKSSQDVDGFTKSDKSLSKSSSSASLLPVSSSDSFASWSSGDDDRITNHKLLAAVHSNFEKHKSHRRNFRRYGHRTHKKNYAKYKKFDHYRSSKHNSLSNHQQMKPSSMYYQGQVSYYGQEAGGERADNLDTGSSYHLPGKMRSHRYQHNRDHHRQYHHMGRNGGGRGGSGGSMRGGDSKWPHLSRVQYQLYEEDEQREEDLPPYIKKYNRRNKQLLDLLEGTMPPPTTTKFPEDLSDEEQESDFDRAAPITYKRQPHRYHNRKNSKWIMEDLFEEQRANPNNPNKGSETNNNNNNNNNNYGQNDDDQYQDDSPASSHPATAVQSSDQNSNGNSQSIASSSIKGGQHTSNDGDGSTSKDDEELKLIEENEIPGDNVDLSLEAEQIAAADNKNTNNKDDNTKGREWSKDRYYTSAGTSGKVTAPDSMSNSANGGGSQSGNNSPNSAMGSSVTVSHDELKVSPKANKFIYHRVASPRIVGTGSALGVSGSKKQRLPFVAITDRRLETSKMRQKDYEQNHLPLP